MCRNWGLAGRGDDDKVGTEVESFGLVSLSKPVRPKEKRGVDANCCCGWKSCWVGVRNFWFGRRVEVGAGLLEDDGRNG